MRLSIACVTKAAPRTEEFLDRFIVLAHELDAQLVFGTHGPAAHFALSKVGSQNPDPAPDVLKLPETLCVPVEGSFLEEMLDPVLEACTGDYILRVDDDELISPAMAIWLKSGAYVEHPSWFFPRFHMWPDDKHVITTVPFFPDFQSRLTTKALAKREPRIHSGSPHRAWRAPVYFEHHNFLTKTKEERRALAAHYETLRTGEYYPPEKVPTVAPEDVIDSLVIEPLTADLLSRSTEYGWWNEAREDVAIRPRF